MINLRILVPEETTNYIKNPSFEVNTSGWETFGGDDAETFTDNFTRANGLLGGDWQTTNNSWTISGNTAITTPTLGVELITNGSFAVDASWSKGTGWTIGAGVAAHAAGTASNLAQSVLTAEKWYKATWDMVTNNSNQAYAIYGANSNTRFVTVVGSQVDTNRAITTATAGIRAQAAALVGTVDNVSYKEITLSDMFATVVMGKTANISANVTLPSNTTNSAQAGVVGWVNDYTSPTDFVIGYITTSTSGHAVKLVKCVAGVYTELISSTVTYAAAAPVEVRGVRSGSSLSVSLYYNGTQISTTQSITDASIIDNIQHGLFSSNEGASFSGVTIQSSYSRSSLATLTRSMERARFGVASGKIVTNGDMLNEGVYYKITWLNGIIDVITASIYARGGGKIRLRLADGATGNNYISKSVNLNDTTWTRIEVTGRCSGGSDVRIWVESANPVIMSQTFYIDGAQLERKSSATTYCDGTREGCRWNLVANSTISTRSADTRAGGRWIPLAGPCRPNNDLYVTVLGGMGMPPIVNNIQPWSNAPGSFFQNEKIQNRVVTFSFHVKREAFRTGGQAPSVLALHELRQQLINLIKSDLTLNSEAFLFEYSDSETEKAVYLRMRYEAGLEGEWDIRNRWFNSFPVRMVAVDPLWSEDSQDVTQLGILETASEFSNMWMRKEGQWQILTDSTGAAISTSYWCKDIKEAQDGTIYFAMHDLVLPAGRVYTWDGTSLNLLATAAGGVFCVEIGPDGSVYFGGDFTVLGGTVANRIIKYNPSTGAFSALGTGMNDDVNTICAAPNGQIYAGGAFSTAGGVACIGIARWDGYQWRTVGATSGAAGVNSITNGGDGNTLYIAGSFTTSWGGGDTLNYVASVDINSNLISPMGNGLSGTAVSIRVGKDGTVYAGGYFTSDTPGVAKYTGSGNWQPLGEGLGELGDNVNVLEIGEKGELYAGGLFFVSGSKAIQGVAKWAGNTWSNVGWPLQLSTGNLVYSILESRDGDLFVGGRLISLSSYYATTSVINQGTASCWPILSINGSGTLKYISNLKTGQEIFLDLFIFSGETVTIDFAIGSISSNTRGDLTYTLLPGSEIRSIYLLPGENKIGLAIINDVGATAQLRWELLDWSADAIIKADEL